MRLRLRTILPALLATFGLLAALPAHAVTDTKTQTVSCTVNAAARLTLGSATVTFANASPATTPSIAATEGAISVTADARTSTAGAVTLTVLAGGDLTSGGDSIGINNVTWTATGSGYAAGTLNKTTAQSVGSWTGPGTHVGTQTFALANSFDYPTGSYSATITYTLTSP